MLAPPNNVNYGPQLNQDLVLYQDRSSFITVPIYDQDGNPFDLTDGSAQWGMALNNQSNPVLILTTQGNAPNLTLSQGTGALAGVWCVTIILTPQLVANIPQQLYYHEVACQNAVGDAVNVAIGKIWFRASVGRY